MKHLLSISFSTISRILSRIKLIKWFNSEYYTDQFLDKLIENGFHWQYNEVERKCEQWAAGNAIQVNSNENIKFPFVCRRRTKDVINFLFSIFQSTHEKWDINRPGTRDYHRSLSINWCRIPYDRIERTRSYGKFEM